MRYLALLACCLLVPAAHAQFAVGGQVGEPTGLSFKSGNGRGAVIGAIGFNLDADRVSLDGHYLLGQSRISGARGLRTLYGPGAFFRSSGDGDDSNVQAGLSAVLGVELRLADRLDLYLHGLPRLQLTDGTDVDLDAALGLRFQL